MTTFLWILTGGFVFGIITLVILSLRKKPCPVGIMLSICLSLVCLISFVVDISVEPVKNTDGQQSAQDTVLDEVDSSVTFADIYKSFKSNELNAKDLYNGNRYVIAAKINGISSGGLLNITGGATLTMEKQVDDTIVLFTAEFEKEQEDALKELSVGDTITFTGVCYGGSFTDCTLQ